MQRKIFRTGNTSVVSIPSDMLDALQLAEGEEVSIQLDKEHRRIVIAPPFVEADGVDAQFAKQMADFIEQYRPALEALAQ